MLEALVEIAESLGYDPTEALPGAGVGHCTDFTGPVPGNDTDPGQLASACWALALLTEMFRNPAAAMLGPLERFQRYRAFGGRTPRACFPGRSRPARRVPRGIRVRAAAPARVAVRGGGFSGLNLPGRP